MIFANLHCINDATAKNKPPLIATMNKMKMTIEQVLAPDFALAFEHLTEDTSVTMKERYAIGRTDSTIRSALKEYDAQRIKLVKQFGGPEVVALKNMLANTVLVMTDQRRKQIEARVAQLERTKEESLAVEEGTKEMTEFREKLTELQKVEFEIYLDHSVVLMDASKLSAKDLSALGTLVTVE